MSFAARIAAEKSKVYCLQYDEGTDKAAYFFLQVDGAKEAAFLRGIEAGSDARLEEFGTVIASGWGVPGAGVKTAMTEKYDIEFKAV